MDRIEELLNKIADSISELKAEVKENSRHIKSIELTLENETNKSIEIIAEGHLDLSRKLDEALKVNNEKEIMKLRLINLENEVRKIKEAIG